MSQSKKKKPSKKSLRKKADKLWAELVKLKAGEKCEVCGKTKKQTRLNSHHIIGRNYLPLRHDTRNGVCLCAACHKFSPIRSSHSNPLWFIEWLRRNRDKDLKFLQENYESAVRTDYETIIKQLEKETKKYI